MTYLGSLFVPLLFLSLHITGDFFQCVNHSQHVPVYILGHVFVSPSDFFLPYFVTTTRIQKRARGATCTCPLDADFFRAHQAIDARVCFKMNVVLCHVPTTGCDSFLRHCSSIHSSSFSPVLQFAAIHAINHTSWQKTWKIFSEYSFEHHHIRIHLPI